MKETALATRNENVVQDSKLSAGETIAAAAENRVGPFVPVQALCGRKNENGSKENNVTFAPPG